jgi:hypothetical protein
MSVLNFLGKFQQNSLLTDVNMYFGNTRRVTPSGILLPRVLTKIVPFITSIDSIECDWIIDLIEMVYTNNTNHGNSHESQLLLNEMMAKTRILVNGSCWLVIILV